MSSQRRSEEDPTSNDLPEGPELSHWERLIFSFDSMHNEENRADTNSMPPPASADDIQTAALLAQLAASNNMFPLDPYSNALQRQSSNPNPPGPSNQRPFVSPASLTSSSYGPHSAYPLFRGGPPPSYGPPSPTEATGGRSRAPRAPTQAGPSTSTTSPDAGDDSDDYEDKRRRNTAASARFRIKKKQRTLDLERSVSDLTGRAEELEREASDLRRENGWLKEIVMLKGGRLAGINLSGNIYPEAGGRSSERRSKRRDSVSDEESDSEQSDDRAQGSGGRKKGKGKAKSKK